MSRALLLFLACAAPSVADRYASALAAPDFDSAWALCAESGSARADCEQAVVTRHARFDRCGDIAAGVWREECQFAHAEHLTRAGDRPAALRACHASTFSVNCEQHVLDGLAMSLRESSAADVASALSILAPDMTGANSALDYWRSWHRVRLDAGLRVASEDCPDKTCRTAVRAQVRREVVDRLGRTGCASAPPAIGSTSEEVTRWIERVWRERCCASPSGGPPGAPSGTQGAACGPAGVESAGRAE
ncbi:MAG: hypothetical protein Q8P18_05370 [Pseudomonadota bacterium]|nr:hypothetical protein [Pseudomonadota bacterium]